MSVRSLLFSIVVFWALVAVGQPKPQDTSSSVQHTTDGALSGHTVPAKHEIFRQSRDAYGVIAEYAAWSGERTDTLLQQIGFPYANQIQGWRSFSPLRKIETAYRCAALISPQNAETLLALQARALAQWYESVRAEPILKYYLVRPLEVTKVSFKLPVRTQWDIRLPDMTKRVVLAIANYASSNGSMTIDSLLRVAQIPDQDIYEALLSARTPVDALSRALSKLSHADLISAINSMLVLTVDRYPTAIENRYIKTYMEALWTYKHSENIQKPTDVSSRTKPAKKHTEGRALVSLDQEREIAEEISPKTKSHKKRFPGVGLDPLVEQRVGQFSSEHRLSANVYDNSGVAAIVARAYTPQAAITPIPPLLPINKQQQEQMIFEVLRNEPDLRHLSKESLEKLKFAQIDLSDVDLSKMNQYQISELIRNRATRNQSGKEIREENRESWRSRSRGGH